jgi:hypothetical protein
MEKMAKSFGAAIFKKLPIELNRPIGANSPNLVTVHVVQSEV